MAETRQHYNLNQNQLHILMLLYKFRFITIPLLTTYKNLKVNSVHKTLRILYDEKYIERKFDSTYKMDRKPAIYYLAKKGVAVLKQDSRFHPPTLHSYYKNISVSEAYMQRAVDALEAYVVLRRQYEDRFDIFTQYELGPFDDFPKTKPDLYLRGDTEYFLTLAYDSHLFLVRKRLMEYIAHCQEDGWPAGAYPTLLFVFADPNNERRFLKFAASALEDAGTEDELRVGTTTRQALNTTELTDVDWNFTGAPSE